MRPLATPSTPDVLLPREAKVCDDCVWRAGNNDIQPFVPRLVECMAKPAKLHDCIHGLAATTFVQAVEGPHLAIIVPLLNRGLQDRVQARPLTPSAFATSAQGALPAQCRLRRCCP